MTEVTDSLADSFERLFMMPVSSSSCVFQRVCRPLAASLLLLSASACSDNTPAKTELKATSIQNKYVVQLHPVAEPITVNQMHNWEMKVATSKGEPVSKANFQIAGGMPQHNHGLPTQPMVTKNLGNGRYLIEGMKFSMTGWWELRITVDADKGTDIATVNTIIPDSAAQPSASAMAMATSSPMDNASGNASSAGKSP